MVSSNTLRFTQDNSQSNRQEIEHLTTEFQARYAGRTVAITHEIREGIALLGIYLIPLTDDRSGNAPNYMLGVVEVPINANVRIDTILNKLDPLMEELQDRER